MKGKPILDFFPFEKTRIQQDLILEKLEKTKKRFILIEAPTGVGKSPIAICASRWAASQFDSKKSLYTDDKGVERKVGSYILTVNKALQKQYANEFEEVNNLSSKENYPCHDHENCLIGRTIYDSLTEKEKEGHICNRASCNYFQAKDRFIGGEIGVTNFAFFLNETTYAGEIIPSRLLIIDECHRIENQLMSFVEQSFNGLITERLYNIGIPDLKNMVSYAEWLSKEYLLALNAALSKEVEAIKKAAKSKNKEAVIRHSERKASILRKRCRLNRFLNPFREDPKTIKEHWVMNKFTKKGKLNLEFKPIEVSRFAEEHLFKYGEQVIMMSATILDKKAFFKSLRVDPSDCTFIRTDSPFSEDSRQVHIVPVSKINNRNKKEALPKIADTVKTIINEIHPEDKGIIHTHSYEIQQFILNNVGSPRLVMHTKGNREEQLEYHKTVDKPTILLSPSMYEGVDLKDNTSRFQIVIKMPFPYLGDKQVAAKKKRFKGWYEHQTAISLIQSFGRSTRNEDDYSITYLLDSNFVWFYERNKHLFPEWLNLVWS